MKEIDPLHASYDDLVGFVTNMLEVANREAVEDPAIRTAYYASLAFVAVANRLEMAAARLELSITDAEGRLRDALQQSTHMFLDAADRAQQSADQQATVARLYAKHLTIATYVLAFATIGLGVATGVLVFYTRVMAVYR